MLKEYYIITNNKSYIKISNNHSYELTSNPEDAMKWNKQESAQNVLDSLKRSKNKILGSHKIEYIVKRLYEEFIPNNEKMNMIDSIEDISEMQEHNDIIKPMKYDLDIIIDVLDNLEENLLNEKKIYENQLIKCSKAITDVAHYLEPNIEKGKRKMSASDRCKLSIFESELLNKRREVKDSIIKIECAIDKIHGKQTILKLEDRTYKPRVLNNLFETGEIIKFEEWWKE